MKEKSQLPALIFVCLAMYEFFYALAYDSGLGLVLFVGFLTSAWEAYN